MGGFAATPEDSWPASKLEGWRSVREFSDGQTGGWRDERLPTPAGPVVGMAVMILATPLIVAVGHLAFVLGHREVAMFAVAGLGLASLAGSIALGEALRRVDLAELGGARRRARREPAVAARQVSWKRPAGDVPPGLRRPAMTEALDGDAS